MATDLRSIKDLDHLLRYLEDELEWPINGYDKDDVTFTYEPADVGIKDDDAAKIRAIYQLRPLQTNQPWGIFYVEFEKKKLPVVVLRRILSHLVIKKRASSNKSEAKRWNPSDLLFISAFGDDADQSAPREIAFAHFHIAEAGDMPTLRVLGWDGDDTPLKIDHVAATLKTRLCWPDDAADAAAWRNQWAGAFRHKIGHTIRTADMLANELARLARAIRDSAHTMLKSESDTGPLTKLYKAFQAALIHDLTPELFADTYAQTITYGLLTAAISRTDMTGAGGSTAIIAENIHDMVPVTNPFLKEMLQEFLRIGGRKNGMDFDELGVQDVVDLLRSEKTDLPAVLRDFGNKTDGEDPVIHFYEHFLEAYNKKLKIQRGVFYTPKPVVSYIVRSVHELLQTEFGLADGLADTTTWGEMVARTAKSAHSIKLPPLTDEHGETRTISETEPFVQILDPATGTATFLVETIDVIYRTLSEKWKSQKLTPAQQQTAWNDYVPKHLLPRLHAYELMMAPYAIAHMKIGLKLKETGYNFQTEERARIYLTNALEPKVRQLPAIGFDALAHEAAAVNEIKWYKRFTVIIGNPPYANLSANLAASARSLIEKYKYINGDRVIERNALQLERNLNDDYVKFIAWSEERMSETKIGFVAMISNNVYIGSPSLRGMRAHLLKSFQAIRVINLHGASQRGSNEARFDNDENVFDIEQPVAISIFYTTISNPTNMLGLLDKLKYSDITGLRISKYRFLNENTTLQIPCQNVAINPPSYRFVPSVSANSSEYEMYNFLPKILPLYAEGIKTGRDWLVIDFEVKPVLERMLDIQTSKETNDDLCARIDLSRKKAWNFEKARASLKTLDLKPFFRKIAYRPFDERIVFYHPKWIASPSAPVMKNFTTVDSKGNHEENFALLSGRISRDDTSQLYWCSSELADKCILSSVDNVSVFPALIFPEIIDGQLPNFSSMTPEPNLSHEFQNELRKKLGLVKPKEKDDLKAWAFGIFKYFYAILWSAKYRERYKGNICIDFPRLPLTNNVNLFQRLSKLGNELSNYHLLKDNKLNNIRNLFIGSNKYISDVGWTPVNNGTVWIDADISKDTCLSGTTGFKGVPEDVWNFHIGGYQVCEKWLKDRKGRTLSDEDIAHYQKIILALSETIRLMSEIDQVIESHGGWPGAFQTEPKS